jgi:hypothetical protein
VKHRVSRMPYAPSGTTGMEEEEEEEGEEEEEKVS